MRIGTNFPATAERSLNLQRLAREGHDPFAAAAAAELDYIELALKSSTLNTEALAQDIATLQKHGLGLAIHPYYEARGFGHSTEPAGLRQRLKTILELSRDAAQHQAYPVLLNFHAASGNGEHAALFAESTAFNHWLVETAHKVGADVVITTEHQLPPEPGRTWQRFGDRFSDLLEMAADLADPRFGLCSDFGHSTMRHLHYGDPLLPPADFAALVRHVHIHDVQSKPPRDHRPIGSAQAPLGDYLTLLLEAGYDANLTMEYDAEEFFGPLYPEFLARSKSNLLGLLQQALVQS